MDRALQMFTQFQRNNTPVSTALDQPMSTPAASAPPTTELVRVDANPSAEISLPMHARGKGHASPSPAAAIAEATAQPQSAQLAPTKEREPVLAMNKPRSHPFATPATPAAPIPVPTPLLRSPSGVALTPFLQAAPAPVLANNGASWRTYAPGQMPRGRVIDPSDAAPLATTGLGGGRLYLRGSFVVTASEENRAVLRPQEGALTSVFRPGAGATRVIVQYPDGYQPPAEGPTFSRDVDRPFMITDVRRDRDGQIDVYVREITTPP